MVIPTFIILGFFVLVFGLVTELINAIWIGGKPLMFPTNILIKLIGLPFLPIKIARKVLHVFFFPFKTILHTFLK